MTRPMSARTDAVQRADEQALIARVADGDRDAFAPLYRVFAPRVRAFLVRVVRRHALLDEVVDDTLLAVWRKARSYSGECSLSTWIFAIAYRKALKANARDRNAACAASFAHDERGCAGPELELQRYEAERRVAAALRRLSKVQHATLRLVYFQGYACREAAGILCCPVDTVKTRMFHARRRMRALLAADLGG